MNDFNSSASVRRLATALNRRFGVWVASPSVALLCALVAGKGRPKRLLCDPSAPPFISNIARIAGALPVHVPIGQVNQAIRGALVTEGLSSDLVWVTAVHRDGHLAATEWLANSRSQGVPSVELCLGSLPALIGARQHLASFTIVQLDAEPSLEGLQLTALLTDDADLADRVRQLSLPSPGSTDYVLDASPRGVTHDEPALLSLLDALIIRAQAPVAPEPPAPASGQGFDLSWNRRFEGDESVAFASVAVPPPSRDEPGKNPWLIRLAEAEARHAHAEEALKALRSQLGLSEAAHSSLNDRLHLTERESAERSERLLTLQAERDRERDQQQREKSEVERALGASKAEIATLTEAMASLRKDLESERAAKTSRESELQTTADKRLAHAQAQIEELKTEAVYKDKERAEYLEQKAKVDRELSLAESDRSRLATRETSLTAEMEGLREQKSAAEKDLILAKAELKVITSKFEDGENERKALLADATRREGELSKSQEHLSRRVKELETEAIAHRERAVAAEAARVALEAQIARFESEVVTKDQSRTSLLDQKATLERDLALVKAEAGALQSKLEVVEAQRTQSKADFSKRETSLESAVEEQTRRVAQTEKDFAAARERAATAEASRSELVAQVARLQADLESKDSGRNELVGQKSALDRDLALSQAEVKTLSTRLERLELERSEAKTEASRAEAALRLILDEEKKRAQRLEKEAATLGERAGVWEASRAEFIARIARLEADVARDVKIQTAAADAQALAEKELKTLSAANSDLSARLAKADEAQRAALEASEVRIAEARLAAQTNAAQSIDSWKSRFEAAEQTTLALKTALDARASEAAAYEKAHLAGHAHRQVLEDRISQLKKRLDQTETKRAATGSSKDDRAESDSISAPAPQSVQPEVSREKAAWEVQRPRFAPVDDADVDFGGSSLSLGGPIDYSAPDDLPSLGASTRDKQDEEKHRSQREVFLDAHRSDFTPEYERGTTPEEETGKSAKGWLRGVASRIRRG
ncbi:MAG: hypothetical protein ABI672_14790 [Vicinamibacteria bacterium]